jgi:hypothetical protein
VESERGKRESLYPFPSRCRMSFQLDDPEHHDMICVVSQETQDAENPGKQPEESCNIIQGRSLGSCSTYPALVVDY